jgi:hypothetical protein
MKSPRLARDAVPLFQDEDDNPLVNNLGIYILDHPSMLQNMQDYAVTADTDIDNYVRECTILVDGTKIYRFSKELLAYIEMWLLSVRTTGRTTHALLAPWTRTSGMHFKNTQTSRTRTSTTTWQEDFVLGTRSSSHQAQPLSVRETLSRGQWRKLKVLTELLHLLRNPGTS